MIASSAARSSVSASRRFVSSKSLRVLERHAHARGERDQEPLVRLVEGILPGRAGPRSTPITSSPARIGTPRKDSRRRPPIRDDAVRLELVHRPNRSGPPVVMTSDVRPGPSWIGLDRHPLPWSSKYGNCHLVRRSVIEGDVGGLAPGRSLRTRSPTRSMIAVKSSCFASAAPISLTTASSALRWSSRPGGASSRRTGARSRAPRPCWRRGSRAGARRLSLNACGSDALELDDARVTRPPAMIGTPSHDSRVGVPLEPRTVHRRRACRSPLRAEAERGPRRDDLARSAPARARIASHRDARLPRSVAYGNERMLVLRS